MKTPSFEAVSLEDLIATYQSAATLHKKASEDGDYRKANQQHVVITAAWKELRRRGMEGRAAFLRLLDDEEVRVRAWAAAHALTLDPARAEAELERIAANESGPVGLGAEMTLREWRKGTLKFE